MDQELALAILMSGRSALLPGAAGGGKVGKAAASSLIVFTV